MMETTPKWTPQRFVQLLVLLLLAAWTIWPLAYMLSTSLKSTAEVTLNVGGLLPVHPTMGNYTRIFSDNQDPIGRWFLNSAVAVVCGTFLTLLCASLAAYSLSRLQWPGRDLVFYLILASTLIPGITFIIPVFAEFANANLLNTYWPIILVYPAGAFGVFLLRQFYLSIPRELEEAAVIDGAGKFRRWLMIILPMTRTPLMTLGILSAVGIYNDFLWPLIAMQTKDMYTITIGISIVTAGAYVNDYGPLMAFSTVAAIPTIVLFIILQRHFVASAALSGVKG
jgi:multiple sugar transport system permease protein